MSRSDSVNIVSLGGSNAKLALKILTSFAVLVLLVFTLTAGILVAIAYSQNGVVSENGK